MINLLEETLKVLEINHVSTDDVLYVSDEEHWCKWEYFARAAAHIDYNDTSGYCEINCCLKIVGCDFVVIRAFYEGNECWEFFALNDVETKDEGALICRNKW